MDQAGLHNISVAQDRDQGVVTLTGKVAADGDKAKADSIANSMAGQGGQVVADEIVLPPGAESDARTVNTDLDKAIAKNVDAALIQSGLPKGVPYDVKNGVVTLKGNVSSGSKRGSNRAQVEKVTSTVPNVRQVVNEVEVRDKKLVPRDERECRITRVSGSSLRACRSKSAAPFRPHWRKPPSPTGWRSTTRI